MSQTLRMLSQVRFSPWETPLPEVELVLGAALGGSEGSFSVAEMRQLGQDCAARATHQLVGETAGETINEMTARILAGDKLRAIAQMVRPYPTFAEGPAKAAMEVLRDQFFTERTRKFTRPVLHLLRKIDKP